MPSFDEKRDTARKESAQELVNWARDNSGTYPPYELLLARLIVAIEELEGQLRDSS